MSVKNYYDTIFPQKSYRKNHTSIMTPSCICCAQAIQDWHPAAIYELNFMFTTWFQCGEVKYILREQLKAFFGNIIVCALAGYAHLSTSFFIKKT